jgi:DnaJ-class molecular chaperone
MACRYHPDNFKMHEAKSRFQEIAEAFRVLRKLLDDYCYEYDLNQRM